MAEESRLPVTSSVVENAKNEHEREEEEEDGFVHSSISEPSSPTSATSAGTSVSPHYDHKRDIIVTSECLSDGATKAITRAVWAAIAAGTGLLIAAAVVKSVKPQSFFLGEIDWYIMNLVFASLQVLLLFLYWIYFIRRVVRSSLTGKRWSHRRKRGVTHGGILLTLQLINSVMYLIPNAHAVALGSNWLSQSSGRMIAWTAFVSWTTINAMFAMYIIMTASLLPIKRLAKKIGRVDAIVIDGPWWLHWPVLLLWVPLEGFLLAYTILLSNFGNMRIPADPNSSELTNLDNAMCPSTTAENVLSSLVASASIVYLVVYIIIVRRIFVRLYGLPYSKNRMGNLLIRMNVRLIGSAFCFFIISIIIYFYVDFDTCAAYFVSWMGFTPAQLVLTAVSLAQAVLFTPRRPDSTSVLQVWLQEFAWLEKDVERKRCERVSSLPPDSFEGFCMDCEPLFCFELAVKLCYWAYLVYDNGEIPDSPFTPSTATKLFGLEHFDIVWEKKTNAKAVIGWNSSTVVVAFRGTASVSNLLSDLQVWRVRHPKDASMPSTIARVPMVHRGFLNVYTAEGFNDRLLSRVEHIISGCQLSQKKKAQEAEDTKADKNLREEKPVRLLITGHSLGGAMAVLCAYDMSTRASAATIDVDVSCYTFGAPRVGNHAWARLYDNEVPDTWQIINSDDAITRAGKFWVLYKHVGHRVLINRRGDLLVRPSFVEYSIRRSPGGSVRDHYLTAYQQAMVAVVAAQFGSKALGSKDDVLGLAEEEGSRLALGSVGLSAEELRRLNEGNAQLATWPFDLAKLNQEGQWGNETAGCFGGLTCLEVRWNQFLERWSAWITGRTPLKEVNLDGANETDSTDRHSEGVEDKEKGEEEENEGEKGCVTSQVIGDENTAIRNAQGGWKFQIPKSRGMQRSNSSVCPLRSRAEAGLLHCHTMCKLIKRGSTGISSVPVAPMQDPPVRPGRDVEEASSP